MLSIVLSACLLANPQQCKDFTIPVDTAEAVDSTMCAMIAPPYFARWSEEHPAWQVRRWKCIPAGQNDI